MLWRAFRMGCHRDRYLPDYTARDVEDPWSYDGDEANAVPQHPSRGFVVVGNFVGMTLLPPCDKPVFVPRDEDGMPVAQGQGEPGMDPIPEPTCSRTCHTPTDNTPPSLHTVSSHTGPPEHTGITAPEATART